MYPNLRVRSQEFGYRGVVCAGISKKGSSSGDPLPPLLDERWPQPVKHFYSPYRVKCFTHVRSFHSFILFYCCWLRTRTRSLLTLINRIAPLPRILFFGGDTNANKIERDSLSIKAHVQDLCVVPVVSYFSETKVLDVLLSSFHFFIERDNAKYGQHCCLVYVVAFIDCVFALTFCTVGTYIIELSRQGEDW